MRLRVAFTTNTAGDGRGSVCIVVDVVRASTTILTLVERGVGSIRFATETDEAKRQATASNPPALLIGEQGGIIAPGFDLDNSPLAIRAASIEGRVAVMRTSNGTVILSRLGQAPAIFVGCVRNGAAAIAAAIAEAASRNLDILICCAGQEHGTVFALDDAVTAGFLVALAWEAHGPWDFPEKPNAPRVIDESAIAALALYRSFVGETTQPDSDTMARALLQGAGPRFIATTGRLDDVRYCAAPHQSQTVPRVVQTAGGPAVLGLPTAASAQPPFASALPPTSAPPGA